MSLFLLNTCEWTSGPSSLNSGSGSGSKKCGMVFDSLIELIQHIEDHHIDYDPAVSETSCLPLSCIQRFTDGCTTTSSRKEGSQFLVSSSSIESLIDRTSNERVEVKRKNAIKHHSYSISSSKSNSSPTGSEIDEDEIMVSESEDSNESWTTEEFSSEFIMRYGSRSSAPNGSNEKPFACPVPGCKKRYKNVNGIKYHSKNGHKKDGNRIRKAFKCHCGKSYKTSQKLKNHTLLIHSAKSVSSDVTLSSTSSPSTHHSTDNSNGSVSPLKSTTINYVSIKTTPKTNVTTSSSSSNSGSTKISKDVNAKNGENSHKSTKVNVTSPSKVNYDGFGILTPATSPSTKQSENCQSTSIVNDHNLNSSSSPVSNILSSNFQIFKKHDS